MIQNEASSRFTALQKIVLITSPIVLIALRVLSRWPLIASFDGFAFRDNGSFLKLDHLLDKHLKIGVDVGYPYGFLPILVQRFYSGFFGSGPWQMIGFQLIYAVLNALFWVLLLLEVEFSWARIALLIAFQSFLIIGLPTPAHGLMQLSIIFALYFLLKERLDLALLVAAIGSLALPTIPIPLAAIVSLVILLHWLAAKDRHWSQLVRRFVPAVLGYLAVLAILIAKFGRASVLPSLLPLRGAAHYKIMNYGFVREGRNFWDPAGANYRYYLGNHAGIWILSSLLLLAYALACSVRMFHLRRLRGVPLIVVTCAILHVTFVSLGFGGAFSSVYYEPLLAIGLLLGICEFHTPRVRGVIALCLLVFGVLGSFQEGRFELRKWRDDHASAETANLFASESVRREWVQVLDLAARHRVFVLSVGGGLDTLYPQVGWSQSWFLLPGITTPRGNQFVVDQMREADVVAEATDEPIILTKIDPVWRRILKSFPVHLAGQHFELFGNDRALSDSSISYLTSDGFVRR
ncbi:MAG: hypothetical protein WA324_18065 [Bryobacteraceae bacterium]